ncbi:MAG: TonB-dependent receptor [Pseudomonadota bacterium]
MKIKYAVYACLLASPLAIHAQANTPTDQAEADTSSESTEETTSEVITVTGQKLNRSLQETKESVAVITQSTIQNFPIFDFKDVFDITANAYEIQNGENFGIRGVTQSSLSTGGGAGELASLYIDGVAFTGFATRFGTKDLWDVQQVEILRGPQSTNVGRNALIGAVVVTTNKPEIDVLDGSFGYELGEYGREAYATTINIPVSESSALRFSGEYSTIDGYIYNEFLDDENFDERKSQTFRLQYRFQPSQDFTLDLMAQYAETESGNDVYRGDLTGIESRVSLSNLPAKEDYDTLSSSIHLTYQLSQSWSVKSISSYIDGSYSRFDDDDLTSDFLEPFRARDGEDTNWAQEVRFNYESDSLEGALGVYYTEVDVVNDTLGLVALSPTFLGVPDALAPFYPSPLLVFVDTPFEQNLTNMAFFTEWDYRLSSNWSVSAGFRYDYEEQDIDNSVTNSLGPGMALPDPAVSGQIAEVLAPGSGAIVEAGITQVNQILGASLTPQTGDIGTTDYDAFLPQLGLTYAFNDNVSLSSFYKRGYRSGGVDINLIGARTPYDPEYLDNYEIALRSQLLDGALTLNANAYFGDWTDQQVSVCIEGNQSRCVVQNAGESEIYGLEIETQYSTSEDWMTFLSVGYSQTEFTDFQSDTIGDITGNEFAYSPEYTVAVGGQFFVAENVFLGSTLSYQDETFADVTNQFELDEKLLLDINLGIVHDMYRVDIYLANATDEFYLASNGTNLEGVPGTVRAGSPREFGVRATMNF